MTQPRNYFNDKSFSDVLIKFGRHKVHAHRVILARCSAQFEKEMIIDPETDMAVVNLKATYDAKAIYVMLKHCYGIAWEIPSTPACLFDFDFVLTVYNVADTYGISDLHQQAREKFCSMVSDFFLQWLCGMISKTTANCFIWTLMRVLGPFAKDGYTALQEEVFENVCHGMTQLFGNKESVQLFARGEFFGVAYGVRFAQRIRDKLVARERHSPIHDEQIEVFRRVVGLDAVQFADVSLQEEMFCVLKMYVREVMQTTRVAILVGRGEMFSQEFAERFTKRISALLVC